MAARKPKDAVGEEIHIVELDTATVDFFILGTSPFIFNAMSQKVKMELLMPKGRKSAAEKAVTLKHHPLQEYRNSMYRYLDNRMPTRLKFPAVAFKKAMASAALDMPGLKKAQIGRLVWPQTKLDVPIWGIPQMMMGVVRSADISRTPDIRTRAILPQWASKVSITFVRPMLNQRSLANLMGAAGQIVGVGDGRQEKGTFSCGQFTLVGPETPEYAALMKYGTKVQDAAIERPAFFDSETEQLYTWFEKEIEERGQSDRLRARPIPGETDDTGRGHRRARRTNGEATAN